MMTQSNLDKPKLIYVGDPMCSWCYGFSDELAGVVDHYEDMELEMVMGGLRPYNQQPMTQLKDFLVHHWEEVQKASGQEFSYGILDSETITYDTEPPCRASVIVRSIAPEKELQFFAACQSAFYKENKNMHLAESYHHILEGLNISSSDFDGLFDSSAMKTLVKEDFVRSRELGINSFPTLLLENGDKKYIISRGYAKSADIIRQIDKVLGGG